MNKRINRPNVHSWVRSVAPAGLVILTLLLFFAFEFLGPVIAPQAQAEAGQPASMAASAEVITKVFQRFVSPSPYYAGVSDTYLSLYEPDSKYGGLGTMRLHTYYGSRERILVKFDIPSDQIPRTANVLSATLELYCWYRYPAYNATAFAYTVRRQWSEADATWNQARSGNFWAQAGCGDPLYDYTPEGAVSTTLKYSEQPYTWDVTALARNWVANPTDNQGVLIMAEGFSVEYQFRTSEDIAPSHRPKLTVIYELGAAPTATPTRTMTPVATATSTATPTITRTPLYSPTATQTATVTPTITRTPTRTPLPPPIQVDLQQGVSPSIDYAGVSDTFIGSYRPDSNWSRDDNLRVSLRSSGMERSLVRFDLQPALIPADASIQRAELTLFAWSRRTSYGMRISVFDLSHTWEANMATWRKATASEAWGLPGCDAVPADHPEEPEFSRFVYFTGQSYTWDVTALVRRWVADPSSNRGMLLIGYDVDQDLRFRSSEWSVPEQRPKLTIVYERH